MAVRRKAVVLGADIEGLAAAATLAAAGRDVVVLEAGPRPGGIAGRVEITDGYSAPGLLTDTSLARRALLAGLGLERHGLAWREAPGVRVPGPGEPDATAYQTWRAYLDRIGGFVRGVLDTAPPVMDEPGVSDLLELVGKALRLRSLGDSDMMELLRIATLPARDWLDEQFASDVLKAAIAAPALTGSVLGPRAAGTTALILLREAARGEEPAGGAAALVDALVARCEAAGVILRCGTAVKAIEVDTSSRCVTGVRVDGETVETDLVLSALDPGATLLDLVAPGLVPRQVEAELETWRRRADTALHVLACSPAPGVADRFVTAASLDALERSADALKYAAVPDDPCLDARVWRGPPHAPEGGATIVAHVRGVGAAGESTRDEVRERTLQSLGHILPELGDALVADRLLMPVDLETRFGLRGGHLWRGEMALDQLWLQRPSIALSRYATPVGGLFLAGSGSHPGGPWLGGTGVLGARQALGG